jgi:uncharacterized membrane protein YdfJ with MMPL/SSD domain
MVAMSRFVLRHKGAVVVFWLAVLLAGGAASAKLGSRLSPSFALPSAASYQADQQILRLYGNGGSGDPEVALVRLPPGQDAASPAARQALGRAFAAVTAQVGGVRVADYASTRDRAFLGRDGRTTYGLVFTPYIAELSPPSLGPQITAAITPLLPAGSTVAVTGMSELQAGGQVKEGFSVLAETLLAGLAALAVLVLVFGSALALVPLLVAAVAIPACFLAIYGLAEVTTVSVIVQYLAALIGLGVAIDYSLLLVTRWREELAVGHSAQEAVSRAMATAGRSVAYSGITVAVGLLSLVVLPVPALRSIGIGGMIVPVVSVAVTLTLLPVLLATVARRLDWPRRRPAASRAWTAWARMVVRRRWLAAPAALAVLGILGAVALGIKVGEPAASSLGTATPAAQALQALEREGIPAGVLDPIEVLVPASASPAGLAARLSALPGVRAAVAPTGPAWRRDGTALISVQPDAEPSTQEGAATIARVRQALAPVPGSLVGGPGALLLDENHAFYGRFPLLVAVLAVLTVLLLAKAFGSLLLPIKAVLLNLASVGATYGVLVLVWQHGHGSRAIWGLPATGAITNWVPLIAFAFLYGLSMDYEVFILTRVREERDRTGSTTTAITEGIGRTGRLVTGAALILFLAFAALSTGPETDVKVLATALGAGILLDATIVRALLVPALIAILGRWNWWLPPAARRLLRVPASRPESAPRDYPAGSRSR